MHAKKDNAIKRFLAAALVGVLATFGARADDPVSGATLYKSNCTGSNCHNTTTPLTSNATKIYMARNARNWIQSNINSDNNGMGKLGPTGATPMTTQQVADVAAYLGNWPSTLSFASTAVGSTAATQTVTIAASLKSSTYSISGLNIATSGDFARQGGTCGTSVAFGTTCTVIVAFMPTVAGSRTGTLSIIHSTTLTPITIALSGTATGGVVAAPVASVGPVALTLASTAIGATSPAQNVSVANTGNAALSISAITLGNAADFVIAGGTCSAGGSVPAGSSCTVSVAFKPSAGATGVRSGSLSIVHDATGSPGSVSLSGTATAAPAPLASLTASLAFGSVNVGTASAAQTAMLSNGGTAALTIGALSTSSTEFTISGGSCSAGGSVAAGSNCSITLGFTPSTAGARSASLVVAHNGSGGQSSTSLSGMGLALTPVIGASPATLSFSQTTNTTSASLTATVSNTGSAPLAINALSIAGAQASEFQLATGTTCIAGGVVAVNTSCLIKVAFTPAATGARNASLSIAHNAAGSPSSIALNGTGTLTPQPAIALNAPTLSFAAQALGSTSASQTVTVSNSGAAALTLSAMTLAGTAAADFTRNGTCTPTSTLAVGASCSLGFSFTPGALGARSATLTLASNASNGNAALSLDGTGVPVPTPSVGLSPGALDFGSQTTGVASTVRTATLSNSGSGALNITAITATSGFNVTHGCGASLAAGATCTLSVTFTPAANGTATGEVSVASNAVGSPHKLSLAGVGVIASPVLSWIPAATALDFGDVGVGAAAATRSLTLSNQGPGAVTLQQITLAGAQAADFSFGSGGTCVVGASLALGATCTLSVAFQSGAAGPRSATLQLASTGSNPPAITLTGNGSATAAPGAAVVPHTLDFVALAQAASDPQTLTLQSTGNAVLHVSALRIASGSFTIDTAAANGCPTAPFDLMPGQSCALVVDWSNNLPGSEAGMVEIDTSASAAPLSVSLLATRGTAAAQEGVALSNVGAGGCSIARGDTLADPTLWLLALLAAGVLWRRRATLNSASTQHSPPS